MRLRTITSALVSVLLPAAIISSAIPTKAQEQLPWQHDSGGYAGNAPSSDGGYSNGYSNNGYQPPSNGYATNGYSANGYQSPPAGYANNNGYQSNEPAYQGDRQYDGHQYGSRRDSFSDPQPPRDQGGYGEPYSPPPEQYGRYDRGYDNGPPPGPPGPRRDTYEQSEIISAGHRFFGSISQGLASAVEYAFKSQGRPNGYILGQDAGGAFVFGLRYGEGKLFTKDAGEHPVFWQGPSLGYDAGAEGSKTMVLVYNLRDPSEIYHRFAGVQGAAYLVGGVSVQFQKYGDVMLGVIRSGVGLRLGANVGYLKYTRTPTWNPL